MYSKTGEVKFSHTERACAAIQDQPREVRAAWNLSEEVTIEPCRRPSDLEGISYASISAEPNVLSAFSAPAEGDGSNAIDRQPSGEHGAIGGRAHGADDPGRPYAQVRYVEDRPEDHRWWTVTLSHECIEMAINPYMDRTLKASPLPDFAASGRVGKHEEVHYLKEICDPCQSGWHAYPCERPGSDQPVWLSDFLLPDYFDWQPRGSRFSFTGSVTRPFENSHAWMPELGRASNEEAVAAVAVRRRQVERFRMHARLGADPGGFPRCRTPSERRAQQSATVVVRGPARLQEAPRSSPEPGRRRLASPQAVVALPARRRGNGIAAWPQRNSSPTIRSDS